METSASDGTPPPYHAPVSTIISVRDWIEATRDLPPTSFVERAVDVAWMLSRVLCNIIDNSELGAQLPQLEDHIRADNVILYALQQSNYNIDGTVQHSAMTIADAKFRSLIPFEPPLLEGSAHPQAAPPNLPSPHPACAALGKLLLDIFLKFDGSTGLDAEAGISGSDLDRAREDADGIPEPAGKRRAIASTTKASVDNSNASSARARDALDSSGMPLSISRLIGDLLDAEAAGDGGRTMPVQAKFSSMSLEDMLGAENDVHSRSFAIRSIHVAMWDLSQMRAHPAKFLFDRTCPLTALDDTCLFRSGAQLIGREREMSALMNHKDEVSSHVRDTGSHADRPVSSRGNTDFLSEASFLCGYAGSGKSSLVNSLTRSCLEDHWFVLSCKFTQQSSSHTILAEAFNGFFGKWGAANYNTSSDLPPEMVRAFNRMCTAIFNLNDDEGLRHLCDVVPNFARVFPLINLRSDSPDGNESSIDKVGSGRKRMRNLFHVLLKSLCSVGHPGEQSTASPLYLPCVSFAFYNLLNCTSRTHITPNEISVLFTLDDLHWSETDVVDDLSDFMLSYIHGTAVDSGASCRRGLLVVGTFRSNEVDTALFDKISSLERDGEANVSLITIGNFSREDATELVSMKLCIPCRYGQELADVVHNKTRGNVFFMHEFLRSIIRNKMLQYSVKYRLWIWDCDVVDMQMISDDVAQLLTTTFEQLPSTLQNVLRVISCLGFQVDELTIDTLDAVKDVSSPSIKGELPIAIKEGILEKAGPIYQWTHDIIYQTIYQSIPKPSRIMLHKAIGEKLIKTCSESSSIHTLATNQVNIFCNSRIPVGGNERLLFAQSNAKAAKIAISASSFIQAGKYLETGIELLDAGHWQTQYSLSLDLFEMSASVSWAQGELSKMERPLSEIASNAKEFGDTLIATSLSVQRFTALSIYDEAMKKCFSVLEELGEALPAEYDVPFVLSELSSLNESLQTVTAAQMKQLPLMTDKNKLSAMKFLNLLGACAIHNNPMLLHIASCRMVKLTLLHGFCDDSIVGLGGIGLAIFHNTENFELASRIRKVTDSLIELSSKKHRLRSRLTYELDNIRLLSEPVASAVQHLPDTYNSAMMVGDSDTAIRSRNHYCGMVFWTATVDLSTSLKNFKLCFEEAIKYQQHPIKYLIMARLNLCSLLMHENTDAEILSLDELDEMGEKNSPFLLYHSFFCRLMVHFFVGDYLQVVKLVQWYDSKRHNAPKNRMLDICRAMYEGIACFHLARNTNDLKWKAQGEKAMEFVTRIEPMCRSNFENKVQLLRAELHYLEGDLESAAAQYEVSVASASAQRFIHEEAVALELYGIFCVENRMPNKGIKQLRMALERYKKWGAKKKVEDVQQKIDLIKGVMGSSVFQY